MSSAIEPVLFAFLVVAAVAVVVLRNLFAAAMMTGLFSFISAGLFTLMDAVDVAFTEAAVGAGISTILVLATLALTGSKERRQRRVDWRALSIVTLTGAALIYGTLDMPHYGDPSAPIHHHMVERFLTDSLEEVGMPNFVTSILASYRGYDTFGETTVIFTAATGVLLLLAVRTPLGAGTGFQSVPPPARASRLKQRVQEAPVLRATAKGLLPFIFMFALYVQFHGDFGPGGGFQAGVIFAAGFILYGLVFGPDALRVVAPSRWVEFGVALGVVVYGGTGVACLAMGGNFLDYSALDLHHPTHGQHLGIFLVELGVGITVACVMLTVYYAFSERPSAEPASAEPTHKGPTGGGAGGQAAEKGRG